MIWVVLDSKIYVSSLIFGGNPRAKPTEQGFSEVSVSDPIKAEVERVLGLKFSWPKERIRDATAYLWTLAHSTIPQQTVADCIDPEE